MSQYTVIFLCFLSGLVAGMIPALLAKWAHHRYLLELDYRLADVEGRVTREVKIRANAKSIEKRNENSSLDEWAKEQAVPKKNDLNFTDWYKSKMVSPIGKG